jgi:quercetin dioxygenase-like cupin family protein
MNFYDFNEMESDAVSPSYLRKAVYGELLTIARIEVHRGEITQSHCHETEEVIFVLNGAWLFRLPDGEVILRDNQMICIPPGVVHSSEVIEDTVAIDVCSSNRSDWSSGQDKILHSHPEQFLWAV